MNGLIKQLFTHNCQVARLFKRKTRYEKDMLVWVPIQGVWQNVCLNFHKMNRCHYFLLPVQHHCSLKNCNCCSKQWKRGMQAALVRKSLSLTALAVDTIGT